VIDYRNTRFKQANARALRIFGGTSEVMLEIIGRSFN